MIHQQQDILENILFRLPAKSIGRFRCVSKPWRTHLSHPNFIKTHLNRIKQLHNIEEQSLIFVPKSKNSYSFHTSKLENGMTPAFATHLIGFDDHPQFQCQSKLEYLGSCDGLTLIKGGATRLFLGNPTTKEFKELLGWPLHPRGHGFVTMYGVGYDSTTDDYKVVALFWYRPIHVDDQIEGELFVEVYSVKNGTWKTANSCPFKFLIILNRSWVFVDGFIHCIAYRIQDESSFILAFDLTQEKFCVLPYPSAMDMCVVTGHHLSNLGGYLCMYMTQDSETYIWVMKEYGVVESWIKFTIIDTEEKSEYMPICLQGTDQIVLAKKGDKKVNDKLVMYNLNEGSFKDIAVEGITDIFSVGGTVMDTLVSPHCTVEAARED